MKVLYIISATNFGGATLSFLTLMMGLLPLGVTPVVVIPNKDEKLERIFREKNIKYYVAPVSFCVYPHLYNWKVLVKYPFLMVKMLRKNISSFFSLKKIVKKECVDIIHTNVGPVYVGHFVASLCGIPHIWHIREYGNRDFKLHFFPSRSFFKKMIRKDNVIAISNDLYRYNDLDASKKSYIVYNGVCKRTETMFDMEKKNFFLTASRVSSEKKIDMIIRVFAKFHEQHRDYKLVILGEGPFDYVENLKMLTKSLRLNESVLFEGHVSNVYEYMQKAKALLVASPAEGFGRMTAEACFAGCLVIGNDVAGTKEILDQTGGMKFSTEQEFLSQMNNVAEMTPEKYGKIVKNAQNVAINLFSEESYIQKIFEIYKKSLCEKEA